MKKEHKAVITAFETKMVQAAAKKSLKIKIEMKCEVKGKFDKILTSKSRFNVTLNGCVMNMTGADLSQRIKEDKFAKKHRIQKSKHNAAGLYAFKGVEHGINKCFDYAYNAGKEHSIFTIYVIDPFVSPETGLTLFSKSKVKVVFSTNEEMTISGSNLLTRFKAGKFYPTKFTKTVKKNKSQDEQDLQEIKDLILAQRARRGLDNSDIKLSDIKVSVNEGKYQSVVSFLNGQKPKEVTKRTHSYVAYGWIASTGVETSKIGSSSNVAKRITQLPTQFDFKFKKLKYVFDNNATGTYIDYEQVLLEYLKVEGTKSDKQHLSGMKNNLNKVSDEGSHKRMKKHIKKFAKLHSHALVEIY